MLQIFAGKTLHVPLHFCGIFVKLTITIQRNDDKVIQTFHRKCCPIRSSKSSIFCLGFSYFAILHHNCNLFNTSKPAIRWIPAYSSFPEIGSTEINSEDLSIHPCQTLRQTPPASCFYYCAGVHTGPSPTLPLNLWRDPHHPSSPSFSPATKKPGPVTFFWPDF